MQGTYKIGERKAASKDWYVPFHRRNRTGMVVENNRELRKVIISGGWVKGTEIRGLRETGDPEI